MELPSALGTTTHQRSRVAARDISRVIDVLVKTVQPQLQAGRHFSVLLPARSKRYGEVLCMSENCLNCVQFSSPVKGCRDGGDVGTRSRLRSVLAL